MMSSCTFPRQHLLSDYTHTSPYQPISTHDPHRTTPPQPASCASPSTATQPPLLCRLPLDLLHSTHRPLPYPQLTYTSLIPPADMLYHHTPPPAQPLNKHYPPFPSPTRLKPGLGTLPAAVSLSIASTTVRPKSPDIQTCKKRSTKGHTMLWRAGRGMTRILHS